MINDTRIQKLGELAPDPRNANKGTARGRRLVAQSLKAYGAGRSILLDKNGNVIAGNKTIEGAKQLGLDDVVVVASDGTRLVAVQRTDLDLAEPKARELAIADNRASEIGLEWDVDVLAGLETQINLGNFWTAAELDKLLEDARAEPEPPEPQLDKAAQLQQKWGTAQGQLWEIGKHRLMCGDSREQSQRALLLSGEEPSLLNTDPPYEISIVGNTTSQESRSKQFGSTSGTARRSSTGFDSKQGRVQRGGASRNSIIQSNVYRVIEGDDKPFDPEPYLTLAPIVILWGANYFADKLPMSSCWICWDKREGITRNSFADCELAWCSAEAPARCFHHLWNGLHKGSQNGECRTHPTEKPVALFQEIGDMYAPQGLWLDLFAGTGAQLCAAQGTGARCFAMEWEPIYVAVTLERLSQMGLKPKLAHA